MSDLDVLDRIADRFTIGDGCWEWINPTHAGGYSNFTYMGEHLLGHRVMYELLIGPIPDGLELDHLCRNRACIRPSHLEPVTRAENMRRGIRWAEPWDECSRGHPRNAVNTYVTKSGSHDCRVCRKMRRSPAAYARSQTLGLDPRRKGGESD